MHPRYLAGIIVDCGDAHRLCLDCMKRMADNSQGHCCPICQDPIKDGEIMSAPVTDEKLQALIEQLENDKKMVSGIFKFCGLSHN
jgi:predicted amidophosphoribosyltransferase